MFKLPSFIINKKVSNALYEKAYELHKAAEKSATADAEERVKRTNEYRAFIENCKIYDIWDDEDYETYCKKQEAKGATNYKTTNYKTLLIGGGVVIAAAVGTAAYFLLRHTDEVEVVGETVEVTDTVTNVE